MKKYTLQEFIAILDERMKCYRIAYMAESPENLKEFMKWYRDDKNVNFTDEMEVINWKKKG